MARKRIKRKDIDFESDSMLNAKYNIKKFLRAVLPQCGLKRGIDYNVTKNYLWIRHMKEKTGKVLIALKEAFPVFNFYWETPRILVWF